MVHDLSEYSLGIPQLPRQEICMSVQGTCLVACAFWADIQENSISDARPCSSCAGRISVRHGELTETHKRMDNGDAVLELKRMSRLTG